MLHVRTIDATNCDDSLQLVTEYIKDGFPKNVSSVPSSVISFFRLKDELSLHDRNI